MKHLNFLSKSSSRSCGHRVTTLASTVGSPSAHRRGIMLRLLSVLVLVLTIGVGNVWGATSNLTFSAKCNGSGKTDDNVNWTITSDASEENWESDRGIHYGANNDSKKVQYITLTSDSYGSTKTITKVEVEASGSNSPSLSVTVGGIAFGTTQTNLPTSNDKYTFEPTSAQSSNTYKGVVVVDLRKSSKAKKALYVKSVSVTYTTSGGTTYTVTYNKNHDDASGTMTDSNSPYSSGATVTVLDNDFTAPENKVFDHWNTASDNSGINYDPDETFSISANTTLYAQWKDAPSCDYTAASSLKIGDEIIIVIPASQKQMKSSTSGGEVVSYPNICPDEAVKFTIVEGYNEQDFAIKTIDNKYLSWSSGTGVQLATSITSVNQNWEAEKVSNTLLLKNKGDNRYLLYYNSNNMRLYQNASQASTEKPTIYVINGCDELGSINGSFFWTTHFCPAWPAKHRS